MNTIDANSADGSRRVEKAIVEPLSCDCRSRANGGHRYPAHTRLRVPKADLELEITPWLFDKELEVSVRYWGGRRGARHDARAALTDRGYLELTGYADG